MCTFECSELNETEIEKLIKGVILKFDFGDIAKDFEEFPDFLLPELLRILFLRGKK